MSSAAADAERIGDASPADPIVRRERTQDVGNDEQIGGMEPDAGLQQGFWDEWPGLREFADDGPIGDDEAPPWVLPVGERSAEGTGEVRRVARQPRAPSRCRSVGPIGLARPAGGTSFARVFDITIFGGGDGGVGGLPSRQCVVDNVFGGAERWCLQRELCPSTGRKHWQGRYRRSKTRIATEVLRVRALGIRFHLTRTSTSASSARHFYEYCSKEDSRDPDEGSGPFRDAKEGASKHNYIPKRFRNANLRPWQLSLKAIIEEGHAAADDRKIVCIIDEGGNHGKSFFTMWCEHHYNAIGLPPGRTAAELLQIAHGAASTRNITSNATFFVDLPRAQKGNEPSLFAALEQIKNGRTCDQRYKFRQWYMEPPAVIVFTNTVPSCYPSGLTPDRWSFYKFEMNMLVSFVPAVTEENVPQRINGRRFNAEGVQFGRTQDEERSQLRRALIAALSS